MDTKRKVLIVDDEEVNRALLHKYLEDKYEIFEAVDGEDAIEKIQEHGLELSLILLDIIMPKKDGFEVLDYLNQFNYIGEVPVILITADTHTEREEKAFDLGVSDFVTKPFNPTVIMKRVENIVNLFERSKELKLMIEEQQMIILKQADEMMNN